jgi:hypothetical protein
MPHIHTSVAIGVLGVFIAIPPGLAAPAVAMPDKTLVLPGGGHPLDLDDMIYFSELGRVVVPGAQSGNLYIIDPATDEIAAVPVVERGDGKEGGVASAALADPATEPRASRCPGPGARTFAHAAFNRKST